MANCEFAGGLQNVRGTLSKTTYYDNGVKYTKRVVATVRGGQQKIYLRTSSPRKTKVSKDEIAARNLFSKRAAFATKYVKDMYDIGIKVTKKEAWRIARERITC
jgi:hypothetical protein